MMEIKEDKYHMIFDESTGTLQLIGSFMLAGVEGYKPVLEFCKTATQKAPGVFTLDLRQLRFLNSSGINMIAKFIVNLRGQEGLQVSVKGTDSLVWQVKLVKNLKRLMPELNESMEG